MLDLYIKISVIVPIYNARKTIKKCIESLLNQSYKNFEVILIDDGSKDGTEDLINEMEKKDSRIVYYKKKNGGVSSARNLGISKARGKYIIFIDADDQVHRKMLEIMMYTMEKYSCDLVTCQYTKSENIIHNNIIEYKIEKINREEYFHEMFLPKKFVAAFVWNRLYKVDIIRSKKICFDENISICEDTLFNYLYAKNCRNMVFLKVPLYFYNINGNSAMFSNRFNMNKLSANYVYDYILNSETDSRVINDIQIACMWFNEIIIRQIKKQKVPVSEELIQDIKNRLHLNPAGFMRSGIPIKYKIAYLMYFIIYK